MKTKRKSAKMGNVHLGFSPRIFCLFSFWCYVRMISAEDEQECVMINHDSVEFRLSSGGYEVEAMTPSVCQKLCGKEGFSYAALMAAKYCLCSHTNQESRETTETCDVTCEADPDQICGSYDPDILTIMEAEEIKYIQNLTLKVELIKPTGASKPDASVQLSSEAVSMKLRYEVEVEANAPFEMSLHLGDGTVARSKEKLFTTTKHMRVPGLYVINAAAVDEVTLEGVSDEVTLDVPDALVRVNLSCPELLQPGWLCICNVTILRGTALSLTFNYGDDTSEAYDVPDAVIEAVGETIPEHLSPDEVDKKFFSKRIQMPYSEMPLGNIIGFEYFAVEKGELNLLVLTPKCEDSETFCQAKSCQETCSEPDVRECVGNEESFDAFIQNCAENENPPSDSVQLADEYHIKYSYPCTVSSLGYQYFEVLENGGNIVMPGDIIGFETDDSVLGHRIATDDEIEKELVDRDEETNAIDVRHFMRALVAVPTTVFFKYHYNESGKYPVSVNAMNGVYGMSDMKAVDVLVQSPISGLAVTVDPEYVKVGDETFAEVTFELGSAFLLKWNCDNDVQGEEHVLISDTSDRNLTKPFICPSQNNFTIIANASNAWGFETTSQVYFCLNPISRNWELSTDSPQIHPPGNIKFTLVYKGLPVDFPNGAKAIINFGDGSFSDVYALDSTGTWLFDDYVYSKEGLYDAAINVSNVVDFEVFSTQVTILEKMDILAVTGKYLEGEEEKDFYGENKTDIPINSIAAFECEITGTVSYYKMESSDGRHEANVSESVIKYTFVEAGEYILTFQAWNELEGSNVVTLRVRVMAPTVSLELFAAENFISHGEEAFFTIRLQSTDPFTCIMFDALDGGRKQAFGNLETCLLQFKPNQFQWTSEGLQIAQSKKREVITAKWEDNRTMSIVYYYKNGGTYHPKAETFNTVFESSSDTIIKVGFPLSQIWIENNSTNIKYPMQRRRGDNFRMETTALLTDNKFYVYELKWEAFEITDTDEIIREINVTTLKSWNCSAIRIPSRFLDIALYKFIYTIDVYENASEEVRIRQKLKTYSCFTYLEIITTPIIPMIIRGGASYILRGFGQDVHLQASVYSEDPNDLDDKNFEVKWFCRRYDTSEILPKSGSNYAEDNPSGPITDRNDLEGNNNKGGCFGKGPGLMNLDGGDPVLNTSQLWGYNASYEIVALVLKDSRVAETSIILDVIKDIPPGIIVMCEKKVACHITYNGFFINANKWISLRTECVSNCGKGELEFSWEIFGSETTSSEKILIDDWENHTVVDKERMGMNQSLFKENLQFKTYYVKVLARDVSDDTRPKGMAAIYLFINNPPDPGSCDISSTNGTALIDLFIVQFKGWTDPENHPLVDYSIYASFDGKRHRMHYGEKTSADLILPNGEIEIFCAVEDFFGARTLLFVGNVTAELPTRDQKQKWENETNLKFFMAEGNMFLIAHAASADASISSQYRSLDKIPFSSEVDRIWHDYCELPGIDSSYYTIQARDEIEEQLRDERDKEKDALAKEHAEKFRILTLLPTEILPDAEIYGSAVGIVAGSGPLNRESKGMVAMMSKDLFDAAFFFELAHPEDGEIAVSELGTAMNYLSKTLANEIIDGDFLLTDRKEAEDFLDHNLTQPNPFIYYVDGSRRVVKKRVHDRAVEGAKDFIREEAADQIHELKTMTESMLSQFSQDLMVGSNPFVVESNGDFQLTVLKKKAKELSGVVIEEGRSSVHFPDTCKLGKEDLCSEDSALGVQATKWSNVLDVIGTETANLSADSSTVQLSLTNRNGDFKLNIENTEDPFHICIPLSKPDSDDVDDDDGNGAMEFVHPTFNRDDDFLVYHTLNISMNRTSIKIDFSPNKPSSPFIFLYDFGSKPSLFEYREILRLEDFNPENGIYSLLVHHNGSIFSSEELFSLAVGQLANTTDAEIFFSDPSGFNLTRVNMTNEFSSNYSIAIYTTGCYFFVEEEEKWSTEGCLVEASNSSMICCACNHLTSFATGLIVAPNKIDFDYVFANAAFEDNIAIYCTLIVTFSVYIMLVIWARWKDRKDIQKLGATPLLDNDPQDKYFYEILVKTGYQQNSGTKSNVHFIVSGEDDETEVRSIADDQRPILCRAAVDVFVMAVPRCLGQLNYLRIWHDNSGKGNDASWYLDYVIFKDVQTGQKYEFIGKRWFALENDDGLIDRLIPVAGHEQATRFSHLFPTASRRNLADSHLWFSVFLRPVRSRFTRVQRLSCCLAVMYLSMLTSAMWYQRTTDQTNSGGFKFGPFSLTPEQVGVGLLSNLIVFPPSFLMVFFFRKSRPYSLRPSHIDEALKRQYKKWQNDYIGEKGTNHADYKASHANSKRRELADEEAQHPRKNKISLPWWCVIFGWLLVIASIGTCMFFLWAYGLHFGNEKTSKWLTSLVIAFFSSVLLTEPIKIFFLALFMACVCRNPDIDDGDVDEDEEQPYLSKDEEFLHKMPSEVTVKRPSYRPMDRETLEAARKVREKEMKMYSLLREITAYLLYLWVLMVLSYGNRDPNSYFLRQTIINNYIKPGDLWNDFNNVNTERRFWNWTREALLPELFAGPWYNGRIPLGIRLFTDDRNNLKIGYAVLRQIRANQDGCIVPERMSEVITECAGFGNMFNEDSIFYAHLWSSNYTIRTRIPPEYKYMTASDLNGYPFWGQVDWYGGGGYIVPLIAKVYQDCSELVEKMHRLEQHGWINQDTRAVFVEFGTYNAQVNLFAVVTIVAEFLPGGGVIPYYHIDPIKLLHYHTGSGLMQTVCQVSFLVFTFYYTVCEIKTFCGQGKKYFGQYWNLAELSNLLAAYAGIVVEVCKMFVTWRILYIFTSTEGTGYIKLQEALILDEAFCYLIGFLMSLATLKFLKLLRFNKRIGMMASTLCLCAKELQGFGICLLIVFFSFVILFWLTLGRAMNEFRSFVISFESSISMLLKKFSYEAMEAASPVVTPIAFFTFALTASLVLVNILLTIIIQSFDDVKHDVALQSNDYELVPFIINRLKLLTGIGTPRVSAMPPIHSAPGKKAYNAVDSFPDKVDKLVDFVNGVYFEGQLDFKDKEFLKKAAALQSSEPEEMKSDKKKFRPRRISGNQSKRIKPFLDF